MKRAYYRFSIKEIGGGHGETEIITPITGWDLLENYTSEELNKLTLIPLGDWKEIILETKIKEEE